MRISSKIRSRTTAFLHDLITIPIAWFGAYFFRFNLEGIPDPYFGMAITILPLLLVIQGSVYWYFGLYRGIWRYASIPDLIRITKAVITGVALSAITIFLLTRLESIPRSVFILYAILLMLLLGGPRLIYRFYKDHRMFAVTGQKVLVIGGGAAGEMLVRDLLRDSTHAYTPVAIVDDDRKKQGKDIHGVPVAGSVNEIDRIVDKFEADTIIIAIPTASTAEMRRIIEACEKTSLSLRTLPRMEDLLTGRIGIQQLRDIAIDDLLGRDPVQLDWEAIKNGLTGRCILISGAGGSIGSELCRQIARLQPAALVLLDNSEFNLFTIEQELISHFPDVKIRSCLVDVTDAVAVNRLMHDYEPKTVFHAAAYKHVPLLQHQIREAAFNNIIGTKVIANAAASAGVDSFVLISTDKAVNPTNVMGVSKRVSEIYCQNMNNASSTSFITVRFGNVLGSAGSVVPIFRQQIEAGGPVTVTHPDITRYFMTIPEACQLIMQSAVIGEGGEIYVLDMGEPVKISYLAEQMIRLSGFEPGADIKISYTGLRPGEKMYEELFHEAEDLQHTCHDKILLSKHRAVIWDDLDTKIDHIDQACKNYDEHEIRTVLHMLVPEWHEASEKTESGVIRKAEHA